MNQEQKILKFLYDAQTSCTVCAISTQFSIGEEACRNALRRLQAKHEIEKESGMGPARYFITEAGIDTYFDEIDRTHTFVSAHKEADLYNLLVDGLARLRPRDLVLDVSRLRRAGQWSNPDIVRISVQHLKRLRRADIKVVSYEVKPWNVKEWSAQHAFEAAAHAAFAHCSHLVLEWHENAAFDERLFQHWAGRVLSEAGRLGIGVMTFHPANRVNPLRTHLEARPQNPSDHSVEIALDYWLTRRNAVADYEKLFDSASGNGETFR